MKTTLLLVEDDAEVRAVMSELLALDGIVAVEASNGAEAWDILNAGKEEERPRLVLSDIAMPKMNGFQLLDKIRSDPRFEHLPVVLTSGNSDRAKAELEAGATTFEPDAFFAKPFDFTKLAEAIRTLISPSA